jgi:hypothetical protein
VRGTNATGSGEYSSASNSVTPTVITSYESIATVNVSSPTASISFSSIPSTYKHLQIRWLSRNGEAYVGSWAQLTFNGSSSGYVQDHYIEGDGSSASAGYQSGSTWIQLFRPSGSTASADVFGAGVTDILDYTNTNKNKTVRNLGGLDNNGNGYIALSSGLWQNTSAISSITIVAAGSTHSANTQFALYGVKG